jgi:hypothetical protein
MKAIKNPQALMTVLVILSALGSASGSLAQVDFAGDEFRWHSRFAPGAVVEIQGVKGNVRVEPASGDQVEVVAVKYGSGDLLDVAIQMIEHKGGVTFCAMYPTHEPSDPYRCLPNTSGKKQRVSSDIHDGRANIRFEGGGGGEIRLVDVWVDFIVRVPKGVRFMGFTMDGSIEAKSLIGDLTAESVLGDVNVELPSKTDAEVRAETTVGDICSDWRLAIKEGRYIAKSLRGVIGSGQYKVQLNSTTGMIRLRRGR